MLASKLGEIRGGGRLWLGDFLLVKDEMVHVPFIAGRMMDELIEIYGEEREGIGRIKEEI